MPKVKNITKLKKLMAWLDKNSIEYKTTEEERGKYYKYKKSDLFIPKYVISVKIDDSQTQKWYKKHLSRNPVVIRDADTPKFVIEKIQNTIVRVMQEQQLHWLRQMRKNKGTGK